MANVDPRHFDTRPFYNALDNLEEEVVRLVASASKNWKSANTAFKAGDYPRGFLTMHEENLIFANKLVEILQKLHDLAYKAKRRFE